MTVLVGWAIGGPVLLAACLVAALAQAPEDPAPAGDPLVVAVKPSPPFTIKDADGHWHGISIDLWDAVAKEAGRPYELRETTLAGMLSGLADGTVDVGVAALTVTAEREQAFDFTQPFFQGGLGIAVNQQGQSSLSLVWRVLSARFLQTIAALVAVLFASGLVMWLFERRNDDERGVNTLFDAVWWSAVTMTTVGYGDRIPQTVGGRIVAMVWMYSGIILISSFTATISSVLTVSQLESDIDGPEDLDGVRLGTVKASTSEAWVRQQQLYAEVYDTPSDALDGLAAGDVEAVIYDAPVLKYLVNQSKDRHLSVLPRVFARQNYAIGLREGLPGAEDINQRLLMRVESPWYRELQMRYLGDDR